VTKIKISFKYPVTNSFHLLSVGLTKYDASILQCNTVQTNSMAAQPALKCTVHEVFYQFSLQRICYC